MKKVIIAITGGTVLLVGIAMIVLPGPALIVIPAGLAILATEFLWARRALKKCQNIAIQTKNQATHWWRFRKDKGNKPGSKPGKPTAKLASPGKKS
jgi:hypothetical protein